MTVGELRKIITGVPDNFIFEIEVETRVPDEELKKRAYPYPFDSERYEVNSGSYDIGWMEGKMKINIIKKEQINE